MPLLLWSWGSPFSASLLSRNVVKRFGFYRAEKLSDSINPFCQNFRRIYIILP